MVKIDLTDYSGIVTGGASGIGKAVVKKLLTAGAKVIIADVNEETGRETLKELAEFRDSVDFIKTDVTNKKSVEDMVRFTKERFGKINYLVNNAGINIPRLLVDPQGKEEVTEEIFDKITMVNQKGAVLCAQAVVREMLRDGIKGVVINMASESALEGSEGQSIYAGTKAALYSYTRSWAKELGKYGIRVVGVAPGILEPTALRTPEYERALAYTRGITVEELRKTYESVSIPLKRVGTLEEVANLVCFLISDLASYITGTVINISGGKSRA
ncbi:MAG: sorbitol-6-phosphate dehydrogenase subunit [bacterium]|nr:sorbitol-6-phosphate dehydrogenase subunit [bacterium]